MGALHENQYTFLIISRSVRLRIRTVFLTKVVEKIKTYISCSTTFFFFGNRAVYEIMWKNIVQPDQATDGNMAHAHCMLQN